MDPHSYDSEEERFKARCQAAREGAAVRAEAAAQAELLAAFRGRRQMLQQMQEEALRDKIRQQHLLGRDVPWPPLGSTEYLAGLSALEQQVAEQQQQERQPDTKQQEKEQRSAWQRAQRRAYARACLRWHPDKFEARWGRQLAAADREAVLARVQEVSQGINAAWEQLQRGTAC
ncbi:hypothetical protein ABPG77_009446 [Micractinium sp. CCAP 211/92]